MEQQNSSPPSINFIWLLDVVYLVIVFVFISVVSYLLYFERGLLASVVMFFFGLIMGYAILGLLRLDRKNGHGFRCD